MSTSSSMSVGRTSSFPPLGFRNVIQPAIPDPGLTFPLRKYAADMFGLPVGAGPLIPASGGPPPGGGPPGPTAPGLIEPGSTCAFAADISPFRSEEHTSELQSLRH